MYVKVIRDDRDVYVSNAFMNGKTLSNSSDVLNKDTEIDQRLRCRKKRDKEFYECI